MAFGLPEVDALASFGGALNDAAPVEDSTTDLSASFWNLIAMNMAGVTQVLPRAICRFVGNASTPTDPVSGAHFSVWGNDISVKPAVAQGATGVYTLTWPTTITDALGVTHTVNLVTGWPNVEGTVAYDVTVTITSPNVATVRIFTASGVADHGAGVTFAIFVR